MGAAREHVLPLMTLPDCPAQAAFRGQLLVGIHDANGSAYGRVSESSCTANCTNGTGLVPTNPYEVITVSIPKGQKVNSFSYDFVTYSPNAPGIVAALHLLKLKP